MNTQMLITGVAETLYMTIFATFFAYLIGFPLGTVLIMTKPGGISPKPKLNTILGAVVNIGRSIPFIILIVTIIPFTRLVVGKAIGSTAAIVPLVVAAAPFVARLVETSLAEVDSGIVEAATAMGATNLQIVGKVLIPEAKPSLVRGLSIASITILGYTAMAGAVGAGGLGKLAISYGYQRYQTDVLIATLILLIILVQVIQIVLGQVATRIDKKNR